MVINSVTLWVGRNKLRIFQLCPWFFKNSLLFLRIFPHLLQVLILWFYITSKRRILLLLLLRLFLRILKLTKFSYLIFPESSRWSWGIINNLRLLPPYRLSLALRCIWMIKGHWPLLSLWLLLIKRVLLLSVSLLLDRLWIRLKLAWAKNWVINIWCLDRNLIEHRIDVSGNLTIVSPLILLPIDDRLGLLAESCIRWLN